MRLWTLHPRYLDPQGLVALWREGLLARAVLRGRTKGYRHHPQLARFQEHDSPARAIDAYLGCVVDEADARGYRFDRSKIAPVRAPLRLAATTGQIEYEWRHLMRKLRQRNRALHRRWIAEAKPQPHPLFRLRRGGVEPWERT
ncbi:MAG TPA: pyrimidine dimer DNA glycosylase/endonuclease V [Nevskiaceae bacterium]|nr:pyrimidine dimer DNA glycosylase/endonuclease V [Nevskiaceae bacterium]